MMVIELAVQTALFIVTLIACFVVASAIIACIAWAWTYVTERWIKR